MLVALVGLSSCGSDKSEYDLASVSHSVPSWMIGTWQAVRLKLGSDVSSYEMMLVITKDHFEYHYPDCDVYGVLSMDSELPMYASNPYILEMTESTDCSVQWDIPTFIGSMDFGRIWSDDDGFGIQRVSDIYPDYYWIYNWRVSILGVS